MINFRSIVEQDMKQLDLKEDIGVIKYWIRMLKLENCLK
jgi:hypothetical protein